MREVALAPTLRHAHQGATVLLTHGSPGEHCQGHEISLPDAFPLKKAEGLGIAKIQGLVNAQNPLQSSLYCTDVQFFALT